MGSRDPGAVESEGSSPPPSARFPPPPCRGRPPEALAALSYFPWLRFQSQALKGEIGTQLKAFPGLGSPGDLCV